MPANVSDSAPSSSSPSPDGTGAPRVRRRASPRRHRRPAADPRARINQPAETLDVEGGARCHLRGPLRGVRIGRCKEPQQQSQRQPHADQDRGPAHAVTVSITHDIDRDLPGGEGRNLHQQDQNVLANENGDHHKIRDDVERDHDRHHGAHQNRHHLRIRGGDDDDNLDQSRCCCRCRSSSRGSGSRRGQEEGLLRVELRDVKLRLTEFRDHEPHNAERLGSRGSTGLGVGAHRRCRGGARHLGDRRHPPTPKAPSAVSHGGRALSGRRTAARGHRSTRLRSTRLRSGGLAAPIGQRTPPRKAAATLKRGRAAHDPGGIDIRPAGGTHSVADGNTPVSRRKRIASQ